MATLLRISIDAHSKLFLLKAPLKDKSFLSASSRELTNHVLSKCSPHRHFILSACNMNFKILKKLLSLVYHKEKATEKTISNQDDLKQSIAAGEVNNWKLAGYSLRVPDLDVEKTRAHSFPYFDSTHYTAESKPAVKDVPHTDTIDLKTCHEELMQANEKFLGNFPTVLDKMARNLVYLSRPKLRLRRKKVPKPKAIKKKEVLYPLKAKEDVKKVRLDSYDSMQTFLTSIGLPCEELEYYPDIQLMSNNQVLDAMIELKEKYGIVRIFSLFLISRVHFELSNKELIRPDSKIVKYGKRKLLCFKQVRSYIELCQMLQIPDLDIYGLMEDLAEVGVYDDIHYLVKKVKDLLSVGATPEIIMNNLDILQGYEFFFEKIELYRSVVQKVSVPSFPVKLFQTRTMSAFQERLAVDVSIHDVAEELGLGLRDLQECWDVWNLQSGKLYYKMKMCLNAGISKQDILNNLKMLDRLPIEKCYAATKCFQDSGLPVSVLLLQEMEKTLALNGVVKDTTPTTDNNDSDETEDWTSSDTETLPVVQTNCKEKSSQFRANPKTLRTHVIYLVGKKLDMNRSRVKSLFDCGVDTTDFDIQDVIKNYEHLSSMGFTKEQLAMCPLVLIHPTEKLTRVTRNVKEMARSHLHSSSYSIQVSDDTSADSECNLTGDNAHVFNGLFTCPTKHLNTIQYFLDKQNSFNPTAYS